MRQHSQGVVGIPTTGRVDGNKVAVTGGTMALSAGNIALDEVMVIDDYDFDFYFNANDFTTVVDTRTTSNIKRQCMDPVSITTLVTQVDKFKLQNVAFATNDDTGESTVVAHYEGFHLVYKLRKVALVTLQTLN